MEYLFDFGKSLVEGVILRSGDFKVSISDNEFLLDVINVLIGAIIGVVGSGYFTFKSLNAEKRYDIEIGVITEKILNPLFEKYYLIQKRKESNIQNLVSVTIFDEIQDIFNKNTCWYFATNKKIKPSLVKIRDSAIKNDSIKLANELEELYNLIEKVYLNKYSK
jgi:hypothetical protein